MKPKNKTMSTYTVAALADQAEAEDLARNGKEAFMCKIDNKFYTYPDVAPDNQEVEITEEQNNGMFILEWNGTLPIIKRKKPMFPR